MFQSLKAFYEQALAEYKKISWPTWDEIKGSTAVVCTTILFLMIVLALYDYVIGSILKLFVK